MNALAWDLIEQLPARASTATTIRELARDILGADGASEMRKIGAAIKKIECVIGRLGGVSGSGKKRTLCLPPGSLPAVRYLCAVRKRTQHESV